MLGGGRSGAGPQISLTSGLGTIISVNKLIVGVNGAPYGKLPCQHEKPVILFNQKRRLETLSQYHLR